MNASECSLPPNDTAGCTESLEWELGGRLERPPVIPNIQCDAFRFVG